MSNKIKKQFAVVVGNPPYQNAKEENKKNGGCGSRNTLWNKFVDISLEMSKKDGFLCLVHPPRWRKPLSDLYSKMSPLQFNYIEMHLKSDGIKTFKATTPYDWYVLQNTLSQKETTIVDVNGDKHILNLKDFPFLPSSDFDLFKRIIATKSEEKCSVLYSRSAYGTDKKWMKEHQTKTFKYPCVHTTSKKQPNRLFYSDHCGKFFGTSKIIFGNADTIQNCIIDMNGEYGITQEAIGIVVKSESEGKKIKKAIESEKFNNFLQRSLRWSQFRIDWGLFVFFRKDFWKEFI